MKIGYSFAKTVWKAVRPALIGIAGAAAGAAASGIDVSVLTGAGVPGAIAIVLVEGLRNILKQRAQ